MGAKNKASRCLRLKKTILKNVNMLQDRDVANCDVFCLIRNPNTGHGWYCGTPEYVNNFKEEKASCAYNPGTLKNEFEEESMTNTNTFGIPKVQCNT